MHGRDAPSKVIKQESRVLSQGTRDAAVNFHRYGLQRVQTTNVGEIAAILDLI